MTEQEKKNALSIVWEALHGFREDAIPEGIESQWDQQWDEICGAMANITEELGLNSGECHD
tara:strand:- start:188 stop:370 length:183 start_codon:yes stop_codon:yes gene_type:complete